jgi:hypothetical protein
MGIKISGFSANTVAFLAILSAALKIGISDKIVFTGHIASTDGTIGLVKSIPEKLQTAINDSAIDTFICPDINREQSITDLAPRTKQLIEGELGQAKNHLTLIGVKDTADLVRAAFIDSQVVMASLKAGFFGVKIKNSENGTVVEQTARYFTDNLDDRFWQTLSEYLFQGRSAEASMLLSAFVEFHLRKEVYPHKIGRKLFQTLASLPPATRRIEVKFPLTPIEDCIELGQYAQKSENRDVLLLLKACSGDGVFSDYKPNRDTSKREHESHKDSLLETILFEIGADNLTAKVANPIDQARSNYTSNTVLVSHEDFNEIIASFYLHLLRHTRTVIDPVDMAAIGSKGLGLLERSFAKNGGYKGALAEARHGINGGVRFVLDTLTQKFIQEQQEKYIGHILKTAMDPLDWEGKVKLMEALMQRLKPYLPEDIASQPTERFADQYEHIVRAYAQSMDQVTSVMRLY